MQSRYTASAASFAVPVRPNGTKLLSSDVICCDTCHIKELTDKAIIHAINVGTRFGRPWVCKTEYADAGDFIAFLRVPGGSDHHVIAVIKGDKPGIHHTSFEVNNIDEMGIAGQRMMNKGYRNGWGIGRHALGSNFFWYIRDPHNGLAEYFSDIDYISDDRKWRARDWPMEVSFFLWGPPPPAEFGRNFEGTRKTTKPKPLVLSRT